MRNLIRRITLCSFLSYSCLFAQIDTRLTLESHTYNSPLPGEATLIINVEARSNTINYDINSFQNAFQLGNNLRLQTNTVSFDHQEFPSTNYTNTEQFRLSDGRVRYIYTYSNGDRGTILTTWTRIVKVTIQYTINGATSEIIWYSGRPNYYVTDSGDIERTGSELEIPSILQDISLPVCLTAFEAIIKDRSVHLNWITASEINNLGFELYKSIGSDSTFLMISSFRDNPDLEGLGNSSVGKDYNFTDEDVFVGQTYWYKLSDISYTGDKNVHSSLCVTLKSVTDSTKSMYTNIPDNYKLLQNYPNPFNPWTNITYYLPKSSKVCIKVIGILGNEICILVRRENEAGIHTVSWNGLDSSGNQVASGIYILTMEAENFNDWKKIILIR